MGNGWHAGVGRLVDAGRSECLVDRGDEVNVVEELLGGVSLVFLRKGVVLILGEVKVKLGEDAGELALCNVSLSELIEILEELLNSHALHHYDVAKTVLNVRGVVGDFDAGLHPAVVDDIEIVGA